MSHFTHGDIRYRAGYITSARASYDNRISGQFGGRAKCVCGASATPCGGIARIYIRVAMHTPARTVLTAGNDSPWTVQMAQRRAGRAAFVAFALGIVAACSTNEIACLGVRYAGFDCGLNGELLKPRRRR